MKNLYFLLLITFLTVSFISVNAQDFITTWKTDNPDVFTDDLTIDIPIGVGVFNYNVDWGDGNTSNGLTTGTSHTYATAGTYTVSISGTFPHLQFPITGFLNEKLLSVEQWGN